MRKTTVYLPEDLDRSLKARSRRDGVSAAELVRQAVRESLRDEEAIRPRSIGAGSGGGGFAAADDEDVLERAWGGTPKKR